MKRREKALPSYNMAIFLGSVFLALAVLAGSFFVWRGLQRRSNAFLEYAAALRLNTRESEAFRQFLGTNPDVLPRLRAEDSQPSLRAQQALAIGAAPAEPIVSVFNLSPAMLKCLAKTMENNKHQVSGIYPAVTPPNQQEVIPW